MLDSFRTFLGREIAQLRLSFQRKPPIAVNRVLCSGKNILVCLPEKVNVADILGLLKVELKPQNIFVLTENTCESVYFPSGVRVFSLSESGLGFLCLPRRGLIKEIRKQGIDIAIDLHWQFCLPSAYMCAYSGADLRIGFYSPKANGFFNFEYYGRAGPPEVYCELIRLLKEISSSNRNGVPAFS
ncbi:MAG: hypothetical protein DRQ24_00935 [Candidatus Latescibacterota bacterium]|nr:MAG: hypothetical protein DRQ24_00935 [Candidatus Latescibacterota bacterium]